MPISSGNAQFGVTWITPADAVQYAYGNNVARPNANVYAGGPYAAANEMLFRWPIPPQINGRSVYVTQIDVYGYTSQTWFFFDSIALRRSAFDSTAANDISYTSDIGNGSSGNFGPVTIFSGNLQLANAPYLVAVKCGETGHTGTYEDWRIFGFKVTWEAR